MPRFLATLVVLAILASSDVVSAGKVRVDVYYEQLCPYSVLFITDQLVPAYEQLKGHFLVNLVPFGKASYVEGHPTKFTCQHGPAECQGNKGQACTLYEIQESVKVADQEQTSVEVVACIMTNRNNPTAAVDCSKTAGLSNQSLQNIQKCSNDEIGDRLLIQYGKITKAFESPLLGVPSVAINGTKNKKATEDLIGEICRYIDDAKKPDVC